MHLKQDTTLSQSIDAALRVVARAPVRLSLIAIFIGTILGGAIFSLAEKDTSWWDGIYWVTVVMPTTGFGDFSPVSVTGRWLYVIVVITGVLTVQIIGGAITAEITARRLAKVNDTPELDDDIDEIIGKLDELKVVLCEPRIVAVLHELHAERQASEQKEQ